MNFVGRIADTLAKANHEVVVYQPIYDENITTTGTKLARVIERPRDFEAPFTLDQMQPDVWMLQEPGFSDLMKIGDRLSSSFTTLCKR
uniref:Uncharacterized protein n=1 Tax=Acrobeloides nanus TaxID=290746 RepID=A0A914EFA6_9BILA